MVDRLDTVSCYEYKRYTDYFVESGALDAIVPIHSASMTPTTPPSIINIALMGVIVGAI